MRRLQVLLIALGLTLVMTACQSPAPTLSFSGTSTVEGVTYDLALEVQHLGDRLVGEYQVDAVEGGFEGTVNAGTVTAELTPSSTCTYAFDGTLTETSLDGTFQPSDCPGGQTGVWELTRQ